MTKLLMISSAPVVELGNWKVRLDVKFLEGMRSYTAQWSGSVACLLKAEAGPVPFGIVCDRSDLDFELIVLPAGQSLDQKHLEDADMVMAAADMDEVLSLAHSDRRTNGAKLIYTNRVYFGDPIAHRGFG